MKSLQEYPYSRILGHQPQLLNMVVLADLNAPLANSTLLANPLQIDLEPSAADPTDTIRIVRGRTLNSKNLLYCGFRNVKDGKPSTITGRQPWKCVRMKMKYKGGSIVGGSIVGGSIVRGSIVVLNPRFRDN